MLLKFKALAVCVEVPSVGPLQHDCIPDRIPLNRCTLPPLEHHQNIASFFFFLLLSKCFQAAPGHIYVLVEPECDLYAWSAVTLTVSWRE